MKLTRHNGRTGKHGTYNPRHNDRRFDVGNSEHIDPERAVRNVYWDCYRGFTTAESREDTQARDFTFEEIERMYYTEHYSDHVNAQNTRNEKTRHTERNRTIEDLLKNSKTCPEESIIKGVEDDEYIITEVRTDNGYTLLKEAITVAISQKASSQLCDCYSRDALGLIQNDPRYAPIIQDNGSLHNIPDFLS